MKRKKQTAKPASMKTMILSLVLAVIAWIAVTYVNDPDIKTTLPGLYVHFNGETALRERGLVITGRKKLPDAAVSVSGKRRDLIENMDEVHIEVDVSDIREEGQYTLKGSVKLPTTRISVEKEKYGDITVNVEKLCEKEIPIKIKQSGTLKSKLVDSVSEIKTVKITGSQSELDMVSYGLADVDISKLGEDGISDVKYLLVDRGGGYIEENETIEAQTSIIRVKNTVYDKKTLPIKLKLGEEMSEKYILNESKSVSSVMELEVGLLPGCEAQNITVLIDRFADSATEFALETAEGMYIPESYKNVKIKPALSEKVTRKIDITPYGENLSEGLGAEFESITVEVSGLEDKINGDNVKAKADLSGLSTGEYTVPVTIEGDTITTKNKYKAFVTIKQN